MQLYHRFRQKNAVAKRKKRVQFSRNLSFNKNCYSRKYVVQFSLVFRITFLKKPVVQMKFSPIYPPHSEIFWGTQYTILSISSSFSSNTCRRLHLHLIFSGHAKKLSAILFLIKMIINQAYRHLILNYLLFVICHFPYS